MKSANKKDVAVLDKVHRVKDAYLKRYGKLPNEIRINQDHYSQLVKALDLGMIQSNPLTLRERSGGSVYYVLDYPYVKRMSARFNPKQEHGYVTKRIRQFSNGHVVVDLN